jgi:HPt (histidine-containing phosphotransfer) domain-containing protein
MSEPVDLTNLREMTDGDREMERELFAEFFSSTEEGIESMAGQCTDGANETWRATAHAMKGTSVNLGANALGELCKKAQENDAASAVEKEAVLADIKQEYQAVKSYLQNV